MDEKEPLDRNANVAWTGKVRPGRMSYTKPQTAVHSGDILSQTDDKFLWINLLMRRVVLAEPFQAQSLYENSLRKLSLSPNAILDPEGAPAGGRPLNYLPQSSVENKTKQLLQAQG